MLKKIVVFFTLFMVMANLFPTAVFAAEDAGADYYLSYKKYVEAENPDGSRKITYNEITQQISNLLDEGMRRYKAGVDKNGDDGYYKPFSNSYGFWYETSGFEKTVMGYISGARVTEVELHFSNVKKAVNNNESVETVQKEVDDLVALLQEDADILDELFGYKTSDESGSETSGGNGLAWATFGAVFAIIVREGLEAILIVGAMVAYLVKTDNKKGTKYVYIGAVAALFASFIMAAILYTFTGNTGNSVPQEYVEGITALIAVVVLFYVSNWMVSKAESEAWTNYISGKVSSSADSGKMMALGFTSFLAVFREGAEVILFCQQYFSRAGSMKNGYMAVFAGVVVGLLAVMVVFFLIRVFGIRLPLKPFFMATSILMAVMSISFIGAGMWELFMDGGLAERIGGVVQAMGTQIKSLSWMTGNNILEFFGIYPTWITLIPQIILTIITVITFVLTIRKPKSKTTKTKEATA